VEASNYHTFVSSTMGNSHDHRNILRRRHSRPIRRFFKDFPGRSDRAGERVARAFPDPASFFIAPQIVRAVRGRIGAALMLALSV
jgi:hypothetical protein